MPRYNPAEIERKWQRYWEAAGTFATPPRPSGEKLYILDMFPYPSGEGLHVGHPEGYTATDIVARWARMRGKSVMHPMGFDAFGLPAEEHAIKTGVHPRIQTERNISTFRRQLKMLGFSYDWDRELATIDPGYFRWTQWIFLQLYDTWFDPVEQKGRPMAELPIPDHLRAAGEEAIRRYQDQHRLAYQAEAPVNWCPALGTVLANEEVVDGRSERGNHPVFRRPLRQWMLRITAYADRLERGLDDLDWPESIKLLQRNWIGKSTGAEVDFFIGPRDQFDKWQSQRAASGFPAAPPGDDVLRVYTTRPDTLFGATYMVLAPEHKLVDRLTTGVQRSAVDDYRAQAASKSDLERTELSKAKTGVFSGSYAINPLNGQAIPIWIADYVLVSYGTGAIMAVPAHDTRDFEFARTYDLPIVPVVDPLGQPGIDRDAVLAGEQCAVIGGVAINSGPYNGLPTDEFKGRIVRDLEARGWGRAAVNYKLRDWLFSRQRFWGEPFPLLHDLDAQGNLTGLHRPVPESQLPVDLPHLDDYRPHGRPEPPLASAPDDWLYPVVDGRRYKRETNTMPQWAGSCWYYLRFLDPRNDRALVDPEVERAWMPVDLYVGGAEHAVLHLLYARFWHKVLYDRGVVSTDEPFRRLINQGMILGEREITGYQDEAGAWVSAREVTTDGNGQVIHGRTRKPLRPIRVPGADAEKREDHFVLKSNTAILLESRAYKMSKSRGNVINPDEIVTEYGADTLRLYEMYMGPLEQPKPWSQDDINGVRKFLSRAWRMIVDEQAEELRLAPAVQKIQPTHDQLRVLHKTIAAVTRDTEKLSFNTAIARMIEFVNYFTKQPVRPQAVLEPFVLILSPYAPHIAEELWQALGHDSSLAYEPWPQWDEAFVQEALVEIPVQIKGKLRSRIKVSADLDQDALVRAALDDEKIAKLLHGKEIAKTIVVPGRLVNFVTREAQPSDSRHLCTPSPPSSGERAG
jgi:leucyl-tRNA synthetase